MNFVPKERSQKTIKKLLDKIRERSERELQEMENERKKKLKNRECCFCMGIS